MERNSVRQTNQAQLLLQSFPGGAVTDTVTVEIYNATTSAINTSATAMTNVRLDDWKYSWTPTAEGFYIVTYYNSTLDVKYFEYVQVSGSVIGVPSASSGGSTLTTLISRFLQLIDNYNANDLDINTPNTSGAMAALVLNEGLQTIYSDIKATRYLDAYASTALVSTSGQSYIELSAITDLDELWGLKDTTNQITLIEIPAYQYFRQIPDPSGVTGTPYRYCRIFNRIYLDPQPTAVIIYTTEYKRMYARLSSGSDVALIPTKYDYWIYCEARIIWLMGEDVSNAGAISAAIAERDRVRDIFINDISSGFNTFSQGRSHFRRRHFGGNPYDHLNMPTYG